MYDDQDDDSAAAHADEQLAEEYESALGRAIQLWQKGQHIPMDLFAELNELGFDVPTLEARYFIY